MVYCGLSDQPQHFHSNPFPKNNLYIFEIFEELKSLNLEIITNMNADTSSLSRNALIKDRSNYK